MLSYNILADDVFLSKEQFLEKAFVEKAVKKDSLRFTEEVKNTAQKIMGSKYKKVLMKMYGKDDQPEELHRGNQ